MDLEGNIKKVFQRVLLGSSEVATHQTQEWEKNHGLATQLQNSLESMRTNEVNLLVSAFGEIHDQLVSEFEITISQRGLSHE